MPERALRLLRDIFGRDAPFRVPLHFGTVRAQDLAALAAGGKTPEDFQEACRAWVGGGSVYGFAAGRMAFFALLRALEVGPGDEVILPAYTCVVVPNAVQFVGARPVYAEIDPRTFNLDPADVARKLGPRTRVVMAQHTYGIPAAMDQLHALAPGGARPMVLEDACHALGATLNGRPVGSLAEGAFVSTDATKMICTDVGGFAVANTPGLAARLRSQWEQAAELPAAQQALLPAQYRRKYRYTRPAYNWWAGRVQLGRWLRQGNGFQHSDELDNRLPTGYPYPARFPASLAGVGVSQLQQLPANLAHRRRVVARYREIFRGLPQAQPPPRAEPSWLQFPLRVRDPARWRAVFDRYVQLSDWFNSPAYGCRADLAVVYRWGSCPVSEQVQRSVVAFPTHFLITDAVLDKIEDRFRRFRAALPGAE